MHLLRGRGRALIDHMLIPKLIITDRIAGLVAAFRFGTGRHRVLVIEEQRFP